MGTGEICLDRPVIRSVSSEISFLTAPAQEITSFTAVYLQVAQRQENCVS